MWVCEITGGGKSGFVNLWGGGGGGRDMQKFIIVMSFPIQGERMGGGGGAGGDRPKEGQTPNPSP